MFLINSTCFGDYMNLGTDIQNMEGERTKDHVTPSVLQTKSFTKTCHEHHVYVLMHVIECVDKFLVT